MPAWTGSDDIGRARRGHFMKTRLFGILLAAILAASVLTGCEVERTVKSAGRAMERGAESASDALKQAVDLTKATVGGNHANPAMTMEEAQSIALEHAGFTADQVTALHTEYEIEHGVPQYDVEFHHGHWEYDYEIHGETGEILSYSKDD